MYYFIDFNDNEVNIYLLTPEQGAEVVATSSGDALFISYKGASNQDVSTAEILEKGVSDMAGNEKQKENYDPSKINLVPNQDFCGLPHEIYREMKRREKSKKRPYLIWKHYQNFRKMDLYTRIGFINYGAAKDMYPTTDLYPETLSQHSFGAVVLLQQIRDWYDKRINRKTLDRAILFMQYHDLGETENGDIPDNQLRNPDADNKEYACLKKRLKYAKRNLRKQILRDFKIYNKDPNTLSVEDRIFRDLCKLADKLDAILRGLIYESSGNFGVLHSKCNHHVSEGEEKIAEIMGSETLVDIFAASFVMHQHDCYYYDIFYKILKAAVIDIRGDWFSDWKNKKSKLLAL